MDRFNFLDWLRGCAHRRTTFPITLQSETYIACLECGRHLPYDWTAMRVTSHRNARLIGAATVKERLRPVPLEFPSEAEADGGAR
jgi:hypothetical protein